MEINGLLFNEFFNEFGIWIFKREFVDKNEIKKMNQVSSVKNESFQHVSMFGVDFILIHVA